MKYLKFFGVFAVLFMALALNIDDSFIARMGFDANYLMAAGVALLIAWSAFSHPVGMVVVIVVLVVLSSLPEATAQGIGFDRDILLAVLAAVILLPLIRSFLDLDD